MMFTRVLRFVTDEPDPPVAEAGVQPPNCARRVSTPPTACGAGAESAAHCATAVADAGAARGTAVSDPETIVTATSVGTRRGMDTFIDDELCDPPDL